ALWCSVRSSGAPQVVVGFAIVAAWELVTAVGVVAFRKPMYNALSLVANMLGLAVLFLMLNAQFLFAAQIIVYAGAVMVLFVFIIALMNPEADISFRPGAIGFMVRPNPLVVFMCIELMLNAVNLAFATMSRYLNSLDGVVFAFLVITVAAAEVVVGIAIIVQVYRAGRQMDVDELDLMKE